MLIHKIVFARRCITAAAERNARQDGAKHPSSSFPISIRFFFFYKLSQRKPLRSEGIQKALQTKRKKNVSFRLSCTVSEIRFRRRYTCQSQSFLIEIINPLGEISKFRTSCQNGHILDCFVHISIEPFTSTIRAPPQSARTIAWTEGLFLLSVSASHVTCMATRATTYTAGRE